MRRGTNEVEENIQYTKPNQLVHRSYTPVRAKLPKSTMTDPTPSSVHFYLGILQFKNSLKTWKVNGVVQLPGLNPTDGGT